MMASRMYTVTTVTTAPYVMSDGQGGYEGFVVDLLDKLATQVGFEYKMEEVKDRQYGMLNNNRWTGMMGQVVLGNADIAAGDLTITALREKAVDFSKPFLSQGVTLLVKKPSILPEDMGFLLRHFSNELIFCILIAMLVVASLFVLINWLNPYEWKHVAEDRDPRKARHSFGLRDSLMFVITTLTFQGYREHPKSLAGRTLAVAWFTFAFFIMAAYITSLATMSFATAGSNRAMPPLPYAGVQDVTLSGKIGVGVVRGGSSFSTIRRSSNPHYKRLADYIEAGNTFVDNTKEGVDRVSASSGKFVMLMESEAARYYAATYCDVMVYGGLISSSGLGLAFRKGSSLGPRINMGLLQLREDGTIAELRKRWWDVGACVSDDEKRGKPDVNPVQTSLRRVAVAFFILLAGCVLAVLFLVGEIVFKKLRN